VSDAKLSVADSRKLGLRVAYAYRHASSSLVVKHPSKHYHDHHAATILEQILITKDLPKLESPQQTLRL